MSELTRAPETTDVIDDPDSLLEAQVAAPAEAPVLISEHEVAFGTAAATALQPAKTRREWIPIVRAWFAGSNERPAQRHYPSRLTYLERSTMAREMGRL